MTGVISNDHPNSLLASADAYDFSETCSVPSNNSIEKGRHMHFCENLSYETDSPNYALPKFAFPGKIVKRRISGRKSIGAPRLNPPSTPKRKRLVLQPTLPAAPSPPPDARKCSVCDSTVEVRSQDLPPLCLHAQLKREQFNPNFSDTSEASDVDVSSVTALSPFSGFRAGCPVCEKDLGAPPDCSLYNDNPLYNAVANDEHGGLHSPRWDDFERPYHDKGFKKMLIIELVVVLLLGGLLTVGLIPYFESSLQLHSASYRPSAHWTDLQPHLQDKKPKGFMQWVHCPLQENPTLASTVIK